MIIEDKVTERLGGYKRVNNNIIYLADIEIKITRTYKLKNRFTKKVRTHKLIDELWENNPGEQMIIYDNKRLKNKLKVKDDEVMVIEKVILKKEISCSFYER